MKPSNYSDIRPTSACDLGSGSRVIYQDDTTPEEPLSNPAIHDDVSQMSRLWIEQDFESAVGCEQYGRKCPACADEVSTERQFMAERKTSDGHHDVMCHRRVFSPGAALITLAVLVLQASSDPD